MYIYIMYNVTYQEKIDALKVLGADVRPVPAVPFDDPDNYNHQVHVRVHVHFVHLFTCIYVHVQCV